MSVLITDAAELYNTCNSAKILTDGFVVLSSSLFSEQELMTFNSGLNGIENIAAEKMIRELETVCAEFPDFKTHPSVETRKNNYDKAYTLLYPNFKDFVTKKYLLEILIERLQAKMGTETTFNFNLSSSFQSVSFSETLSKTSTFEFRKSASDTHRRFLRNSYYAFSKFKRLCTASRLAKDATQRITLFIYDTANDIDLLRSFFERVKADKTVHLDIVQIESGLAVNEAHSAKPFACANIRVFKLQDFRAPMLGGLTHFNEIIASRYPHYANCIDSQHQRNYETYGGFIEAALKELQPHVTLYDNTGEVGRLVSDLSRMLKIKSANVEYGLFSNDFIHMAANIRFDARYCLGEASIGVWKDKKDPTPKHIPIGFLKLDHSVPEKSPLTYEWNSGKFNKVVFFASTWGGTNSLYNQEKAIVVAELSDICKKQNWALVIKKHPAENDTILDKLPETAEKHVFLYKHSELKLQHILQHCDVVCTQNSSITAEGLIHQKPSIFYNKSEQAGLAELIPMSEEPFVYFVNNKDAFLDIMETQIIQLDAAAFEKAQEKYLYRIDQNASLRLLNGLKEQMHEL